MWSSVTFLSAGSDLLVLILPSLWDCGQSEGEQGDFRRNMACFVVFLYLDSPHLVVSIAKGSGVPAQSDLQAGVGNEEASWVPADGLSSPCPEAAGRTEASFPAENGPRGVGSRTVRRRR